MRKASAFLLIALVACAEPDPLQARADKVCREMTAHIQAFLPVRLQRPVPVKIVDVDFIGRFAMELEEALVPEGLIDASARLAELLHQVPPGYDLRKKQIEMVKEAMAGLYDPGKDSFYLVRGKAHPGTPGFQTTVAHELIHAYRDVDHKYFEMTVAAVETDSDWSLAMSCLTEGDATFLAEGLAATFQTRGSPKQILDLIAARADIMVNADRPVPPELKEFPPALVEMVLGRYIVGLGFAAKVYAKGGLEGLEAAFRRPPRSTEQVLHPEKFLAKTPDEPTLLTGGDPTPVLGKGWKRTMTNTMGEFEIRVLFTPAIGKKAAHKAAAGWDGARFHFCEKEGETPFFGMVTTWDTETDAAEFREAWDAWAKHHGGRSASYPDKRDVAVAYGFPLGADIPRLGSALLDVQRRERRADDDPSK
ncbi:MAG: hypothetical protein ACYTGN_02370 [Planctomycetota bacterium]|jgi:hypothetical protein